jgi:DtxR family transcriptional regulator, Mn-dependent transcriptional regulator
LHHKLNFNSMISHTEENYLKAIFKLSENDNSAVSTNAISKEMTTSAASVTDMLKRLAEKNLINYEKYKGVTLTKNGNLLATRLIRRHRLWEVFLLQHLDFSWDEVHDIAEQLEHIQSDELIERLDKFLDFPKFDPHGDPIPDADGNFTYRKRILLSNLKKNEKGIIVGVNDHSTAFLQYLDQHKLNLGANLTVLEHFDYDGSKKVKLNAQTEHILSSKVCQNLFMQKS